MKKIGIKLVVYGAIGMVVNSAVSLAPAINNSLAMTQMSNDNASLIAVNMLNNYETALWTGFFIIGVLLFQKEFRQMIKGIKYE